jgi:hypothetical protein
MLARPGLGLVQQPPLVFQQERFDLGQIHQRIGNR